MVQVSLIDYGCGNIRSVAQAFEYLGHDVNVHREAKGINDAEYLVLPGVGAFEKASTSLHEKNFHEAISAHIQKGNPFLGICVGMQVLMEKGYEFDEHKGLGFVQGTVRGLDYIDTQAQLPHIGWSQVKFKEGTHFKKYDMDEDYFYFNHSFACIPEDESVIAAQCQGANKPWTAMIEKDNMIGIQCHPEKSHVAGLKFLKAFTQMK